MQAVSTSASDSRRREEETSEVALGSPEALMEAFLDGDARAFERLYRELAPRVLGVMVHLSGDVTLAEDLTQAAFLKLYRSRAAYQRGMLVRPWLFAIARNTFIDQRRHLRRRPECLSADGELPEPDLELNPARDREASSGLYDLLKDLPEQQRSALVLRKVHGLSVAEAAGLCGTSPASIKMRVQRAYQNLREILAKKVKT